MMWRLVSFWSLLVLVPSSSFSINRYLTDYFSQHIPAPQKVIDYGIRHFHLGAIKQALTQQKYGTSQWLFYQALLAGKHVENAITLGKYWQDKKPEKARFWYKKALQLDKNIAQVDVARWYLSQQQWQVALQTLQGITTEQLLKHQIIDDYLKLLLRLGKQQRFISVYQAVRNQPLLSSQVYWQQNIKQFQLINSDFSGSQINCENSIQPIATNLDDLHYWQQLAQKISTMPIASFVCFAPARYLPSTQLACNSGLAEQPISCNLAKAQTVFRSIKSRYLLVLLPKGGANSQWGVVYLDAKDSVYVLQHELLHLLGFVDEYALANDHEFCQAQHNSSMNVVVLPKYYADASSQTKQKILARIPWAEQLNLTQIQLKGSTLGYKLEVTGEQSDNQVGLYLAKTCDNSDKTENHIALKPLNQATALLQNQANLPKLYLHLIKQWQFKFKMPSFHYTIAYQAFTNNNLAQATDWLVIASRFETDPQRKLAIQQGAFEQISANFSH